MRERVGFDGVGVGGEFNIYEKENDLINIQQSLFNRVQFAFLLKQLL